VTYLELDNNNLGPEAAKYLSEALNFSSLEVLSLSDNRISAEGGHHLANALSKNPSLKTL